MGDAARAQRRRRRAANLLDVTMFEAVFQSFTETADPTHGKARAAALRKEMERRGIDGFVIPRADEHQNEYVPKSDERLAWLTGFTGSWGVAVAMHDAAALFADGRYTTQAREIARWGGCRRSSPSRYSRSN